VFGVRIEISVPSFFKLSIISPCANSTTSTLPSVQILSFIIFEIKHGSSSGTYVVGRPVPVSPVLEAAPQRVKEVYLVARQSVFDERFRQHATEVCLNVACHACLFGLSANHNNNNNSNKLNRHRKRQLNTNRSREWPKLTNPLYLTHLTCAMCILKIDGECGWNYRPMGS